MGCQGWSQFPLTFADNARPLSESSPRPLCFLHLLGTHVGPDVFLNHDLGWRGQEIRIDEVLHLHIYGKCLDACWNSNVLQHSCRSKHAGTLTGHHFNLVLMTEQSRVDGLITSEGLRHFVWLLLLIGFATKMPSVPVHTWLPMPTSKPPPLAPCFWPGSC